MKRFHVHVAVEDLNRSVTFYSDLFGMKPTVERTDHAKWMIEEPRVNFAISARGHKPGVNHLGFQAECPRAGGARRAGRACQWVSGVGGDRGRMLLRQGQQVLGDRSARAGVGALSDAGRSADLWRGHVDEASRRAGMLHPVA